MTALAFAAAAAAGALVRWQVGRTVPVPYGTLLVNLAGAFALGLLHDAGTVASTVVGIGLLGSLTTFSTFAQQVVDLWTHRRRAAVAYSAATMVGGVAAAWLGLLAR